MALNTKDLEPLAKAVLQSGAPILSKIVGTVLPFPANLVASAVIDSLAQAFGVSADDPGALAGAIAKDPDAAAKVASVAEKHADDISDAMQGQLDLLAKDTQSPSLFVAGWRPAFGWLGVLACAWQMVAGALRLPMVPPDIFTPVWIAFGSMLGLRTVEKWKGISRENLRHNK